MFRSLLAALLVLALIPAVAAANATTWAKRSVLDQRQFTEVVDRTLDSPEAEEALAEQLAPALFDTLVGADERARLVLAPIAGQSADASDTAIIRGLEPRIRAALESPRFDAARERLVIAAHRTLVGLDDPDSTVRIDGDALIVDAADLLRVLLDTIDSRIGALGIDVPDGANVDIELASSPGLAATGQVLPTVDRLGTILPLIAIATALLVIVVAHRRGRALQVVGLAVTLAGAACLGVVWLGGLAVAGAESPISPELVQATYRALSSDLVTQSMALIVGGFVLLVVGGLVSVLRGGRPATPRPAR
ncbi:MAG TPA: hypothetical protein VFU17_08050 [Candidatus Limnocylindrales bacterium]|nr:hypothetical protein [Candidatus Limnocylindrales bacterium]